MGVLIGKINNQIQGSDMKIVRKQTVEQGEAVGGMRRSRMVQLLSASDTIQKYRMVGSQRLDRREDRRLPKIIYRYRPFGTDRALD